jgi:hypothetical protein
MPVDVADLLHELDFTIAEGSTPRSWQLRSPTGETYDVELTTPVTRVTAHTARNIRSQHDATVRKVLVGESATKGVITDARAGHLDLLTESPLQLIINGTSHALELPAPTSWPRPSPQRPAWFRWGVERQLLISTTPLRQAALADLLGTSQQTISLAVRTLGDLVTDHGKGIEAADRSRLLQHWADEYPGTGGQEFGWYSLDTAAEQSRKAVDIASRLDANPLVSGDVAADQMAPWKLPTRGRVYVNSPVDLADDGFVPAPLEEATLVTCTPKDPTVWRTAPHDQHLADAPLVYWDVRAGGDADSREAADQMAKYIVSEQP